MRDPIKHICLKINSILESICATQDDSLSLDKSRDHFIDFLKGFAIICVVLTHNLPNIVMKYSLFIIWGDMAVPLFLTLQAYHVFRSNNRLASDGLPQKSFMQYINTPKVWARIAKPFLFATITTGLILIAIGHNPAEVIRNCLIQGGIGPGSYYVWVYLQFLILVPLTLKIFNRQGGDLHFDTIYRNQSSSRMVLYGD